MRPHDKNNQRVSRRRTGPKPEDTQVRAASQRRDIALVSGPAKAKFTGRAGREAASTSPAVLPTFGPDDSTIAVLDKCGTNGFIVIDLDRNHQAGVDGVMQFKLLGIPIRRTFIVRTRSGGFHLYYQQPPGDPIGCSVGKLGPGIDVRGKGGLAVVPPTPGYSIKVDAPVRPLPQELHELLTATPSRRTVTAPGGTAEHKLGGILSTLNNAVEGERNHTLHWALCRIAEMPARRHPSALWNVRNAARGIGLPDWEIERTIASVFGGNRG